MSNFKAKFIKNAALSMPFLKENGQEVALHFTPDINEFSFEAGSWDSPGDASIDFTSDELLVEHENGFWYVCTNPLVMADYFENDEVKTKVFEHELHLRKSGYYRD